MSKKFYFLIVAVMLFGLAPTAWAELVARYTFDDGTATDSAYYYVDADGTFFGDATVINDANRGKVLSLDGNGDYVKVLNNQVAEFSTESFSYSFWARSPVAGTWFYFWKGENVDADPDMILRGTNCYHDDSEVVRFSLYDYLVADDSRKKRTNVPDVNCIKNVWTHILCVSESGVRNWKESLHETFERSMVARRDCERGRGAAGRGGRNNRFRWRRHGRKRQINRTFLLLPAWAIV